MIYETTDWIEESSQTRIAIKVYENLFSMTRGNWQEHFFLPRDQNSSANLEFIHAGSPSFESVKWAGSIRRSKIMITFEYQVADRKTRVAKGIYKYTGTKPDGQIDFTWKVYPVANLNEVYRGLNYYDTFGSRQMFEYKGEKFYLVESMKSNNNTPESCILLTDSGLTPLIELPF